MQLTDEQLAIIEADFEHCLITAVAGSGKTTTLAHRICFLLNQGHDPQRLLVLMFNRAAKLDFETKLSQVASGGFRRLPEIRTYHAMGLRLYRRFIREGFLQPYRGDVLSEQEIHFQLFNLLRRYCPPDRDDDIKRNKKEFTELAAQLLDRSKTSLLPIEETFDALGYQPEQAFLIDIVKRFERWRKQNCRISFADMLFEPVACLRAYPELINLVANKVDMVLVDEYQDTNEIQHLLLTCIAGQRAKVTVVGDPDQTIYEFRGAQPEFITNRFAREFSSSAEFALSYTFRYGHQVALLANHLISHNGGRKDIFCRAHHNNSKTTVTVSHSPDEITTLLRDIRQLFKDGVQPVDMAVLFRVWSQAVAIELALLAARIPYQITRGKGALANREVNQVIALLELACGRLKQQSIHSREEYFFQLLRFPHIGLKEDNIRELAKGLARQEGFWGDYLLNQMPDQLHIMQKKKISMTATAWQRLTAAKTNSATVLTDYIKHSELLKNMNELALTHETAEERIQHVLGMVRYLTALNLPPLETLKHFDELRRQASNQHKALGLTLTTIHQTKGMEWPCVMITGLSEQYLPYLMRSQENIDRHIQGERRLLYVAITRVQDRLFLYCPEVGHDCPGAGHDYPDVGHEYAGQKISTKGYGNQPDKAEKEAQPSRFINEMKPETSMETGCYLDDLSPQPSANTATAAAELRAGKFNPKNAITPVAERYLKWHNIRLPSPPSKTARNHNNAHLYFAEQSNNKL